MKFGNLNKIYKFVHSQDYGENIYTLQDVINEIRDEATRESLQVLPYEIKYREPTEEDLKFVVNFSKRTGDFQQLSITDIRVIALAVRLEKELNNGVNLKQAPPEIQIFPTKSLNVQNHSVVKDLEFFGYDVKNRVKENKHNDKDGLEKSEKTEDDKHEAEKQAKVKDDDDSQDKEDNDEDEEENVEEVVIDEDEGWITKDNCEEIRKKLMGIKFDDEQNEPQLKLGCMTGDYAMQNVLMQMGLKIISPADGLRIKQTRQFVLRCYACFKINPSTATQFCKHCGSIGTLKRVSITINPDGTVKMYINYKRPINIRGTKYSLPTPRGGKHSNDPIVCEDQRLPQQRKSKMAMLEKKRLTVDSILNDPDYLIRSNPFSMNDVYSRASRVTARSSKVVNPNETRKPTGNRKNKKNRHI